MAKLASVDFEILDISGSNYLNWRLDLKFHLRANNLLPTITVPNAASDADKARAMIYIRRHIDKSLKTEYLTVEDPAELWSSLHDRYDHLKLVILPRARYDWTQLRLQDFKSTADYNSALYSITSRLKLCGETISKSDMLEMTLTSMHKENMILMQQYRERRFTKYSELLSCLLVAEQNNELLLKTHGMRDSGTAQAPEALASGSKPPNKKKKQKKKGKNKGPLQPINQTQKKEKGQAKQQYTWKREDYHRDQSRTQNAWEDVCARCGLEGHWSKRCRTPKYHAELHQSSLLKKTETNLAAAPLSVVPPQYTAEDFEDDDLLDAY